MKINGQRIILTGAASGIGKSLLQRLSLYDCQIFAVDIQPEQLQTTINALENNAATIHAFVADLTLPQALDELFEVAQQTLAGIPDIFVANAGFAYYEQFPIKPDWRHIEKIFQLNVFSPLYALQKMRELNGNRPYYVLMTASAMAKLGMPGYALYAATKAALGRFEDAYRFEPSDKGRLGLVYPIATKTNFFQATGHTEVPVPFPSQTAEQVAEAMLKGILKNKRAIYPSLLFRISRFPQAFFEWISMPYQFYYAQVLQKWLANKQEP
ncbi:MAG TPA: short-chain dehydrogenase [Microscillaceae bacterium]|jgi:short-subunit dehydrogenase|nr:short-chain dehydrogenase [Microscillaceae bacterium]